MRKIRLFRPASLIIPLSLLIAWLVGGMEIKPVELLAMYLLSLGASQTFRVYAARTPNDEQLASGWFTLQLTSLLLSAITIIYYIYRKKLVPNYIALAVLPLVLNQIEYAEATRKKLIAAILSLITGIAIIIGAVEQNPGITAVLMCLVLIVAIVNKAFPHKTKPRITKALMNCIPLGLIRTLIYPLAVILLHGNYSNPAFAIGIIYLAGARTTYRRDNRECPNFHILSALLGLACVIIANTTSFVGAPIVMLAVDVSIALYSPIAPQSIALFVLETTATVWLALAPSWWCMIPALLAIPAIYRDLLELKQKIRLRKYRH